LRDRRVPLCAVVVLLVSYCGARADIWDDPAYKTLSTAVTKYNAKDLGAAESLCRQSLKTYPDNILSHYLLGEILLEKGRFMEAVVHFMRTTALYPGFAEGYRKLGFSHASMKNFLKAREAYQKALAIAPDDADSLKGLGLACDKLGKVDEAVAHYGKALAKSGGKDVDCLVALANLYERKGDVNAAIGQLRRLVAIQKTPLRVKRLAILDYNVKNYKEALPLLDELVKGGKGDPDVHYALGMTRYNLGDKAGALAALQQAVNAREGYVEAHFNLAVIHLEQKRVPKAIAELEKAVKLDPDFVQGHRTLGRIHEHYRYDIEEAKRWYARADEAEKRTAKAAAKPAATRPAAPETGK